MVMLRVILYTIGSSAGAMNVENAMVGKCSSSTADTRSEKSEGGGTSDDKVGDYGEMVLTGNGGSEKTNDVASRLADNRKRKIRQLKLDDG